MSAENVLARLDKVRRTAPGKWIARCPAHDDRSPSLSLKEETDGKTLVYCFAGCSAEEIANAAGFQMVELAPASGLDRDYRRAIRAGFNAADVLRAARFELLLASVAAANLANGVELTQQDRARLLVAHQRLEAAAHATER